MQSTADYTDITNNFPDLPPFPEGVPTAPLLRLSLAKLLAGDTAEHERLFDASVEIGFFYLDLENSNAGTALLKDADNLFRVAEKLFELDLEEKKRYDFSAQNSYFGYKGQGVAVVDKEGNLDRNEFYNVSKDDILGITEPLPAPGILHQSREQLSSFMRGSHEIVTLILNILNDKLALPAGTLANLHRRQAIGGDQVRFVKAPPQPAHDRRNKEQALRRSMEEHLQSGGVSRPTKGPWISHLPSLRNASKNPTNLPKSLTSSPRTHAGTTAGLQLAPAWRDMISVSNVMDHGSSGFMVNMIRQSDQPRLRGSMS